MVWVLDIVVIQWFCGIYHGRCLPLPQLPQHRRLSYALFFATGISSTTLTSLSVVFTPTRCYLSSVTFGVLAGAAIPAVLLMVNPNWPGDFTFPNSYLWFAAMPNSYRVIYSVCLSPIALRHQVFGIASSSILVRLFGCP